MARRRKVLFSDLGYPVDRLIKFESIRLDSKIKSLEPAFITDFLFRIERLREALSQRLSGFDRFGIYRRLLLNERVDPDSEYFLRLSGFVHLLTSTGIHLYAIMSWFVFACSRLFTVRGAIDLFFLRCAKISFTAMIAIAWILQGLRPGFLRPVLIFLVRRYGDFFGIKWWRWSPLLISLGVDSAIEVWSIVFRAEAFSPGRLYYALAVGGGMMSFSFDEGGYDNNNSKLYDYFTFLVFQIKNHFRLSIASWCFVALYEVFHDGFISVFTPILSFLTVFVFAQIVYPITMIWSLGFTLGYEDVYFASNVLRMTNYFVELLMQAAMNLPVLWMFENAKLYLFTLFFLFSAAFAYPIGFRGKWKRLIFIIFCCLIFRISMIFYSGKPKGQPKAVALEQIDVGQGDSAWLKLRDGRNILIDVGSRSVMSKRNWTRFLLSRSIPSIDLLVLTHWDEDHAGSMDNIKAVTNVQCILGPGVEVFNDKKYCADLLQYFELVVALKSKRKLLSNHEMIVTVFPLEGGGSYVNFGDSSKKMEEQWKKLEVSRHFSADSFTLLKASHHGSRTSSSLRFLSWLKPDVVWISVGRKNLYGHPNDSVLSNLSTTKAIIRRTDIEGSLVMIHDRLKNEWLVR